MVYFNTVPPESTVLPSIAMGAQEAYLKKNGIPTKNIFWNLKFDTVMKIYDSKGILVEHHKLIPFYIQLAEIYKDFSKIDLIKFILRESCPEYINSNFRFFEDEIERIKNETTNEINSILDTITICNDDLFVFTIIPYKWVSAIVLAHFIKLKNPECKIILTDFYQIGSAKEALELCDSFDYSIYGSGIKELLLLYNGLKQNNVCLQIPNLIWKNNGNAVSLNDFHYYIEEILETPDFSEYYEEILLKKSGSIDITKFSYPIVNSTTCSWRKCNFCKIAKNKPYIEKENIEIINEIESAFIKYGIRSFIFHSLEIEGQSKQKFLNLLDDLIKLQQKLNTRFWITGKLIPKPYQNSVIYNKLCAAGFDKLLLGIEAFSSSLLVKNKKSNSISTNILAIKSATKEKVIAYLNFVMGLPCEELTDIYENTHNLHFLRFYLNKKNPYFESRNPEFFLGHGMSFFDTIDDNEKELFSDNPISSCLPSKIAGKQYFYINWYYRQALIHETPWKMFKSIRKKYAENNYTYKIERENGIKYFEYLNDKLITEIEFDNPIYIDILEYCDDQIISFKDLIQHLEKYKISDDEIKLFLDNLKQQFLIFFDKNYNAIISVIYFK